MESPKDSQLNGVLRFIEQEHLFEESDKLILAVSGGLDSMTLLHFISNNYTNEILVAHCNFMLRGQESDMDEAFINDYCYRKGISCVSKKFATQEYSNEKTISIQMAARELRYEWFLELADSYGFQKILLAHHGGDVVESFFINLLRGTGVNGLRGIKPVNGKFIRPFIRVGRQDILRYQQQNDIPFREDSSNRSDKYLRNMLRNQILPHFKDIREDFEQQMLQNIRFIDNSCLLLDNYINELKKELLRFDSGQIRISISDVEQLPGKETLLFELLKEYGFGSKDIPPILKSFSSISGKTFTGKTHRLIKDREDLILIPIDWNARAQYYIQEENTKISNPLHLAFEQIKAGEIDSLKTDKNTILIDYDKLEFPLILRHWHLGEYFVPFGAHHYKKVSDFFIDQKMNLFEKENTWILASADKIVWIVGRRSDNRFRVTENTKIILKITYQPQ